MNVLVVPVVLPNLELFYKIIIVFLYYVENYSMYFAIQFEIFMENLYL